MAWPSTFVAGNALTAAQLNGIQAAGLAWTSYTPTTTGITVGSGTVTGVYNTVGKTVYFSCVFTFGSGSAVSASPTFTLPMTAKRTGWTANQSTAFDTSAPNYWPIAGVCDTTARVICRVWPTTAGNNYSAISSTIPFTWASGDILTVQGYYEAS